MLIDSDDAAATTLTRRLAAAGHRVDRAASWRAGLSLVKDEHHLILLERALPEIDGLALVRILRACGVGAPLLVLSEVDGPQARGEAIEAGADDHLARPFADAELLARVATLARPPRRQDTTVLRVADLELDLENRPAVRGGRPVRLTDLDFDLLAHLVRNHGRVVSRASLLQNVRGRGGA
ncbi:MAG: DNA-binding response regulator, partial [Phenylobacterium sp.]|nr:DNA-binding response regulator [Phenylobacterium sp.]